MQNRHRLFRRANKVFYLQDRLSNKQQSPRTLNGREAQEILHAKNSAARQPFLNLEIAKAYLTATDPKIIERTWAVVMREYATHRRPTSQERSVRMMMSAQLGPIRNRKLIETTAEELLALLRSSGSAVNNYTGSHHPPKP